MKQFTEEELKEIYEKHVKLSPEYFKKHQFLPNCPVKAWNYSWKTHDMPRNFAILDFIEWTKKYNIKTGNCLGFTYAVDPELEFIKYENHHYIKYPPCDLHIYLSQLENKLDFFVFNQTIDHLYNPFIAIENLYKYIKPGGYLFTTTPTVNVPHMTPIHYNQYNLMGLSILMMSVGFEIVEVGQWGNYDYICKLFKDHKWPDAYEVGHENQEKNVVQSWILVRKPHGN